MIPRHRPPFDFFQLVSATTRAFSELSVEQVEACFAESLGMSCVWLPSAREGVTLALRAVRTDDMTVVGPSYTCQVVHEAMVRSGAPVRLIDTDNEGFLMSQNALQSMQLADYALILCELFGHAYDLTSLRSNLLSDPRLRIVDAAMTVPVREVFDRLEKNDFAVVSFGIGKCMYAGWGGMGITRDSGLADKVRAQRDALLYTSPRWLALKRGLEIWLRMLAHNGRVYGIMRRIKDNLEQSRPCSASDQRSLGFPLSWNHDHTMTCEWHHPSTSIDRHLIMEILGRIHQMQEGRLANARRYQDGLSAVRGLKLPSLSPFAMSHYTVRVPGELRDAVRGALWRSGIDTGTMFNLPQYLSPDNFPNAYRLSLEVINLPLDASLRAADIDRICYLLGKAVESAWKRTHGRIIEKSG